MLYRNTKRFIARFLLKRRLKPLRRKHLLASARAQGKQQLPASDDDVLDVAQEEIVAHAEGQIHALRQHVDNQFETAWTQVREQESRADFNLGAIRDKAVHSINEIVAECRPELVAKCDARDALADDVVDFQTEHDLSNVVNHGLSWGTFLFVFVIPVLAESYIGGILFADVHPGGHRGAILQMAVFSTIAVALGALGGAGGLPYLRHRKTSWKLFGVFVLAVVGFAFCWYVFYVASFRVAQQLDPENFAGDMLWFGIFGKTDYALAVLVWAMQVLSFTVGVIDGIALVPDYPGYSRIVRRHERKQAALERPKCKYGGQIDAVKKKANTHIKRLRSQAAKDGKRVKGFVEFAVLSQRRADEMAQKVNDAFKFALRLWREENGRARSTRPPRYFSTIPVLDTELYVGLSNPNATFSAIESQKKAMEDQRDRVLRELDQAASVAKAQIRAIGEHKPEKLSVMTGRVDASRRIRP